MSKIFPEYFSKIEEQRKKETEYLKKTESEFDLQQAELENWIRKHATKSTVDFYREWLKGYAANGGKPTHYYDYSLSSDKLFVLNSNPKSPLPPGYGSFAIRLLVPARWSLPSRDVKRTDHNNIYFFDTFERPSWVPVYANT